MQLEKWNRIRQKIPSSSIEPKAYHKIMSTHQYRVLLLAESANPEWSSVPLEGWSLSQALAKITDAHLATHIRNRQALLKAGMVEGRDFTAINNDFIARPVWNFAEWLRGGAARGWTTAMAFSSLAYYSFEFEVWRQLGSRIKAHEFDLVHRITPLSPTSQSPIANRLAQQNVPFVIGPLNGGVPWPKHFSDRQYAEREWLSSVRGLYKLMPGYRSTRKYSSAIIAGSKYTYGELPDWVKEKRVYIPENGVDIDRFKIPRDRRASIPLGVAFVGRLVPYKGADMLLDAITDYLKEDQLELHIIGDGPQRALLEAMVDRRGVRSSVHFHGWVPHVEVQAKLRVCDLMALPSIREFGGAVVVEAMALGLTPIVADYGGPSELVDDATGIRVPFTDKASLVEGMKRAIGSVIRCPEVLDRFGVAGRQKVLDKLTWDAKANQIFAVYEAVLGGAKDLSFLDYR
jgi:glycosyltransferase involved in cell wall biosynthesis